MRFLAIYRSDESQTPCIRPRLPPCLKFHPLSMSYSRTGTETVFCKVDKYAMHCSLSSFGLARHDS